MSTELLCESKNREHFDSILTIPIVQQPIRSEMEPQTNFLYCFQIILARDWRFTWNTITFNEYF